MAATGATRMHLASFVVLDGAAVLASRADRVRIRPLLCHNPNKGTGDTFVFRPGREGGTALTPALREANNKKGSRLQRREPFLV
jgi:hypothetical protein